MAASWLCSTKLCALWANACEHRRSNVACEGIICCGAPITFIIWTFRSPWILLRLSLTAPSCWLCGQSGCSCPFFWARRWEDDYTLWGVAPSSRRYLASADGPWWIPYPWEEQEKHKVRLIAQTHQNSSENTIHYLVAISCAMASFSLANCRSSLRIQNM